MANCRNCGTELNGARFCPSCGTVADGSMGMQTGYAPMPMGMDARRQSLMEMNRMMQYFGEKKDWYDNYEALKVEIEERTLRSFGSWIGAAVLSVLIGLFSGAAFFYLAAVGLVVIKVLLTKKNKEALAVATNKKDKLERKLNAYYEEYGYCTIGLEYTNPAILEVLNNIIRGGRASTPSDAINRYLDDQHNAKMEEEARATTRAMEENNEQLRKIHKQTKRNATYSALSFWWK